GRYTERERVANLVAELALPHGAVPEANFAVGITAFAAGRTDIARTAIDAAIRGKPNFSRAVIAKAQMMRAAEDDNSAELASQYLASYLKTFAQDIEVRIAYARSLVSTKALLSAREEFRRASRELPKDGELVYATALISLQIEDWNAAIADFKRTLEMDPRDKNPIFFNLGLAAEGKKDIDEALMWYRLVSGGEYFVNARLRTAGFVAKRDGIESGRKLLQDAQDGELESPDTRTQLVLAEAQLLRDMGALQEAYQVLTAALAKQPESVQLRYDRAMVADRLNRLDDMERDLRTVINVKPDHAHAYNALGYAFAERNIRLPESLELIRKAISLAPDDPFILDSLGWVQFRMQQTEDALVTLRRAYRMRPDPEIAAHLGEVLWVSGKQEEAQQLWRRALIENPENATLIAVIERFKK
ncbi:MAG: tetratricopeptide repeat protein, partial [Aeromicrobium sp.]|nr:tetratricopeptide repeat protein [Burkholderiales bacterium]